MKICQVHNWHRFSGGSEIVVESTINLLKRRGHEVFLLAQESRSLGSGISGKTRAFACGVYSLSGRRRLTKFIRQHQIDLVHVHELYPLFSPWILRDCQHAGIPVVMTCHDYRLSCPTAFHVRKGAICELCMKGQEYWCALRNCRDNIFESTAYALRSFVARYFQLFNNVNVFIALTEFAKVRLIATGFRPESIVVVPNMVDIPDIQTVPSIKRYAAYVGRISSEKGIETLIGAASQLPDLRLKLAGDGPLITDFRRTASANVSFVGRLDHLRLDLFYRNAKFIVISSECFEGLPMVLLEAMSYGLPVVASKIGGLPDIVIDGVTGLLAEPGNRKDFAMKMEILWKNPELCRKMGKAGREKVVQEYSENIYYNRLMAVYEKALA
jgi:glycosyltransferase involved in cell wall biosynthesis